MTMTAGTVSINQGTGARTGSGFALVLYDALVVAFSCSPAQVPTSVPSAQNNMANLANTIASVIDYTKANAVVNPTLLVAPNGGGPVTGTGTLT